MDFNRRYLNVDDFRLAARRRLPKIFADYVDGGAFSETTLARNSDDFARIALRQRVLTTLDETPDIHVDLAGEAHALPFGPGPVGYQGLYRRGGDIAIAKAAAKAGVPFVLSTFSIAGPETIAKKAGVAPQFQLYLDIDPEVNASYLEQCRKAGVTTLFLTVDTAITSVREKDVRNGFRSVEHITPHLAMQFATRPGWTLDMAMGPFPEVEIIKGQSGFGKGALAQSGALARRLDKTLTWDTVRALRKAWDGKLIIKGISDAQDAAMAAGEDIDGIVLSNHGGRQLDHGLSTISLVPAIREALGPDKLFYVDSGFRRGSDVVKAIALGADFVLMGRPFTWAVTAEGERGVSKLFELLKTEVETTLQLMGLSSLEELKQEGDKLLKFID
ncbi:alpha-hydroxy acid oxidase [uncultured Cohaesibacter sp.]|uniref:alpha-hydroxy acid oxidase n=1 Tax=uncultured Cohaesibacter sp. TaxID=1002546 RepID=UPI00292DEBDB|nr:alpha-hydroxy acid oxidase [uncultured Cohaesibacter sp.]